MVSRMMNVSIIWSLLHAKEGLKMIKGYLVIMNGDCEKNLNGIYSVFVPTRNKEKALEYVKGNGDIISTVKYEVDFETLTDTEKNIVKDRIDFFKR